MSGFDIHCKAVNYYNEIDGSPAQWLRELIAIGKLPQGEVDERSICDIRPSELDGFTQCHFFSGIGGWPYALRLAGWPDERSIWTGSCPCQPFSTAGKRKGTADERHLWPAFRWLIAQRRPPVVMGEQVASKDGRIWLSGVRGDLEAMGYEVRAADLCAAGIGAPHIRQRLFWVAYSNDIRRQSGYGKEGGEGKEVRVRASVKSRDSGENGGLAHPGHGPGRSEQGNKLQECDCGTWKSGPWSDCILIPCADGKARRIEPRTLPLVDGVPAGMVPSGDIGPQDAQNTGEARKMRIRGYGNAIVPQLAAEFIRSVMEG